MDDDFMFYGNFNRGPFALNLISFTPDTMRFNGYFYLEDETMPVERILIYKNIAYHLEIIEKRTYEDTSSSGENNVDPDSDPAENITFFPTNIIEIKYRIIKRLETSQELNAARLRIEDLTPEVERRNEPFKRAREEREHEAMIEFCKTLDYKKYLAEEDKA
jgi:hypothetical protein